MEQQEIEKFMTISELAEFLNIKVSWVRSTVFKREILSYKEMANSVKSIVYHFFIGQENIL